MDFTFAGVVCVTLYGKRLERVDRYAFVSVEDNQRLFAQRLGNLDAFATCLRRFVCRRHSNMPALVHNLS